MQEPLLSILYMLEIFPNHKTDFLDDLDSISYMISKWWMKICITQVLLYKIAKPFNFFLKEGKIW